MWRALSFWIGIPAFVALAGQHRAEAQNARGSFFAITGG